MSNRTISILVLLVIGTFFMCLSYAFGIIQSWVHVLMYVGLFIAVRIVIEICTLLWRKNHA